MRQEKIPFYQTNDFLILKSYGDDVNYFRERKAQGFECTELITDYDYVRIYLFSCDNRGLYICDLWDCNVPILRFAADSQLQKMELIERYLKIAKDMVFLEKELKKLDEKQCG